MSEEKRARGRRWHHLVFFLLSLCVTAGVMGYFFSRHSPKDLFRVLLDMDRRAVLCFIVFSLGQVLFRTWRYQLLLRNVGENVGNLAMFLTTFIRNLFSDLLPARIGTLSYIYITTERLGVPLESASSSFALAFLFDMIAVAPLILGALLIVGSSVGLSMGVLVTAAVVLLIVMTMVLWVLPQLFGFAAKVTGRFRSGVFQTLSKRLGEAGKQVRRTRGGGLYVRLLVMSFLVRICKYGSMYFLFYALTRSHGYELSDLPVSLVFLGIAAAELAASTPISGIAGFGAYEGAWALAFSLLGFPRHVSEETAIAGHLFTQAWGYGLGAAALLLILLPVFGRKLKKRGIKMREKETSIQFGVKIAASIVVISLLAYGLLATEVSGRRDKGDADIATAEEKIAGEKIAGELTGRILFDSNRSGTFGIYTMNPDGSDVRVVIDTEAQEIYPSISPDGEWVAYAWSERLAKRSYSEVWVVRVDGTDAKKLVVEATFPSWSPDGWSIYFERNRKKLMAVNVSSGEVEEILPKKAPDVGEYELVKPRVSNDGTWAAFITDRKGRWNVWIANLKTGETRHIGSGCEPAWAPDSQSLFWIGRGENHTAIKEYVLESGDKTTLQDSDSVRSMEYFPSISADGKYLFYSSSTGNESLHYTNNYQIFVKSLDGREAVRLIFDEHTNRWPSLIPRKE